MTAPRGMIDLASLGERVADGSIETVITAIPDLYGRLVGKRIHGPFFMQEVAAEGMHVCDYLLACDIEMDPSPGYAFTSWASGYGDLHGRPDLGTLREAAWTEKSAVVLCDAFDAETHAPVAVAPRQILKRQIERLERAGYRAFFGSELEFYLFPESYEALRARGFGTRRPLVPYIEDYHLLSGAWAEPVIGAIRRGADASGIPVEFSKGEWGPGQHEINLRYAAALEMADRHVLYKHVAKEVASAEGWALTFMAKLDASLAGSSLHVHVSLVDARGAAAFPGDAVEIPGSATHGSLAFRHFLGGLLAHARDLGLCFAPNVNSYKRYVKGTFAPTGVAWSHDNRTAGFRVVGAGPSLRVECRIPGADANPYLAYAALIAAGLDGLERELDPGPAFVGDVYDAAELPQVPGTLGEAIDAFEASPLPRRAFGDDVVEHLLHFARSEQAGFQSQVTDVERVRYFERI